jgi:hypothetical protein
MMAFVFIVVSFYSGRSWPLSQSYAAFIRASQKGGFAEG